MSKILLISTSEYQQRIGTFNSEIAQLRKPLQWIPWSRLLLFILTGFSIFYAVKFPGALFVVAAILLFTGFLLAGWYDSKLKKRIHWFQQMVKINELEIKALQGDYAAFDPGNEFINQDHPYTHDLDIFGAGSLFQYINRTATIFGKERLADYFGNAFNYSDEILARQQSITELSANIEFRQTLQLIFMDQDTSREDLDALTGWLNGNEGIFWVKPLKLFSYILPLVTAGTIILSATGFIPYQLPIIMVLLQMLIVFAYGRKTMEVHQNVTSQVEVLRKYSLPFP